MAAETDDMERYISELIDGWVVGPKPGPGLKVCKKCLAAKSLEEFCAVKTKTSRNPSTMCRGCINAEARRYNSTESGARNRREARRKWAQNNPEKVRAKQERYRETARAKQAERRRRDPSYRIAGNMRSRVRAVLLGKNKSAPTMEMLGCSLDYLRRWLSHQFRGDMSWENYGSVWELDHVRPCCSFDFSDDAAQRACFIWSNLRPMLVGENRSKNGRPLSAEEVEKHALVASEWESANPVSDQKFAVTTLVIGQSAAKLPNAAAAAVEEGSETRRLSVAQQRSLPSGLRYSPAPGETSGTTQIQATLALMAPRAE